MSTFSHKFAFIPTILLLARDGHPKIEFCLKGRHELFAETDPVPSLEIDTWSDSLYEDLVLRQQPDETPPSRIVGCPGGLLFNKPFQLQAISSDREP